MTSQGADATQEISTPAYQDFLSRSRSALDHDRDETQFTLKEGDEGHVDIMSSFAAQGHHGQDQEPIFLSPVQSPRRYSQFRESQRFKTPVTAGKKRDYMGNAKDSPHLPPNLRSDGRTPSNVMGLSQAFLATQAVTSPYIDSACNERSDRPSPIIDLEARPVTAGTSSPMRPIQDVRAATEPASRYVPVAESQEGRQRREHMKSSDDDARLDSDEDFTEELSIVRERRLRREREQRMKYTLHRVSSPAKQRGRGNSGTKSSPIRDLQDSSPSPIRAARPRPLRRSSDNQVDWPAGGIEASEAETEQEDDVHIEDEISSQAIAMDEEDKENYDRIIQIPETTVRLDKVLVQPLLDSEPSPSIRHAASRRTPEPILGASSAPVAVANSQTSQAAPRSQRARQPKSSSTSGLDFVPQSQVGSSSNDSTTRHRHAEDKEAQTERAPDQTRDTHLSQVSRLVDRLPPSPGPSPQQSQVMPVIGEAYAEHQSITRPNTEQQLPPSQNEVSNGYSNFETAPTRMPPPSTSRSDAVESSPQIQTTPPRQKRKQIWAASAEPSPQQSSLGFDAEQALQMEEDCFLDIDQSPVRPSLRGNNRRLQPHSLEIAETHTSTSRSQPARTSDLSTSRTTSDVFRPPGHFDAHILRNGAKVRTEVRGPSTTVNERAGRASVYDIGASPAQKQLPATRSMTQPPVPAPRSLRKLARAANVNPETTRQAQTLAKPFDQNNDNAGVMSNLPPKDQSGDDDHSGVNKIKAPHNVFACFNGKTRAYYPARCLELLDTDPKRYRIQWEGYEPDIVDAYGVKSLDVRLGDQVKVDLKGFPKVSYVVRGFAEPVVKNGVDSCLTDIRGNTTLLVAPRQRKSLPSSISTDAMSQVPVSAIYLDNNMWQQMKDRPFDFKIDSQSAVAPGDATPMERPSTPSTPSSRNRRQTNVLPGTIAISPTGIFSGLIFAISFEDEDRKKELADQITNRGGTLLKDNFTEMFDSADMSLKPQFASAGFTVLLADHHSRKVKYMQALALGLACINGRWIEACINASNVVGYRRYLLAAGKSDELEGAILSRSLSVTDPKNAKLSDLLTTRPSFLEGMRTVIVMGRGKSIVKRESFVFLIRALGANVEQVSDIRAAVEVIVGRAVDWVFVEDRDVAAAGLELTKKRKGEVKCRVAGNEMIVQSLILGELCG